MPNGKNDTGYQKSPVAAFQSKDPLAKDDE